MQAAGYTLVKTTDYDKIVNDKEFYKGKTHELAALCHEAIEANKTFVNGDAKMKNVQNGLIILFWVLMVVYAIFLLRKTFFS